MTRAKKLAIDSTAAVLAQVQKNPALGPLLLDLHRRLQLWRLCEAAACRRARGCRGNALGCSVRRWKVAEAIVTKLTQRRVTGQAAERLVRGIRALWSEENGVLCEHEEHLFLKMPKGPFLRVFRKNPDGSLQLVSHRDLTDEQARKLQLQSKRDRQSETSAPAQSAANDEKELLPRALLLQLQAAGLGRWLSPSEPCSSSPSR